MPIHMQSILAMKAENLRQNYFFYWEKASLAKSEFVKLSARHRTDKELLDEWIEMTMAEPVTLSRRI